MQKMTTDILEMQVNTNLSYDLHSPDSHASRILFLLSLRSLDLLLILGHITDPRNMTQKRLQTQN